MKDIDYSKLTEITVKSQEELDMIPDYFSGIIYIEFGTYWDKAIVRKRYKKSVEAWENSSVVAWGNSSVVARGNSSVEARENSSVVADGNSQIVDRLFGGRIEITGNARIVYMPKTIEEYCSFYGIKHDKKNGKFFKCVHKKDGRYFSDNTSYFEYIIGERAVADYLTTNSREDCGHGIHFAHLTWCLDYGKDWKDLAILEVEAELDGIILPDGCPGKVRAAEVTVIREVPLEECGVYGKIIAKRLEKANAKESN